MEWSEEVPQDIYINEEDYKYIKYFPFFMIYDL